MGTVSQSATDNRKNSVQPEVLAAPPPIRAPRKGSAGSHSKTTGSGSSSEEDRPPSTSSSASGGNTSNHYKHHSNDNNNNRNNNNNHNNHNDNYSNAVSFGTHATVVRDNVAVFPSGGGALDPVHTVGFDNIKLVSTADCP